MTDTGIHDGVIDVSSKRDDADALDGKGRLRANAQTPAASPRGVPRNRNPLPRLAGALAADEPPRLPVVNARPTCSVRRGDHAEERHQTTKRCSTLIIRHSRRGLGEALDKGLTWVGVTLEFRDFGDVRTGV